MSRRHTLARLSARIGATPLLERRKNKPGILGLAYHRIGTANASPFDSGVFSASADEFADHIRLLKKQYQVITLPEVLDFLERPQTLRCFHVFISFDDGYLDNATVAFPILKAFGLSAIFFVVSAFMGTAIIPWWDEIAYHVRNSRPSVLHLSDGMSFRLADAKGREAQIQPVIRAYKSLPANLQPVFLRRLREQSGVALPSVKKTRFFDVSTAKEMLRAGMYIGSHTRSHPILAKLPIQEQQEELAISKRDLEEALKTSISTIAYPVGGPSAFSQETQVAAKACGYKAAFSFYGGVNRAEDLKTYDLHRIDPEPDIDLFRLQMASAAHFNSFIP